MSSQTAPILPETNQVQPETTPVQPIPSSPKSKLPLILAVIILLGIVGGVGVFFGRSFSGSKSPATIQPTISPTPIPTLDPTANWKTYNNQKYGFSFKYPSTWVTQFLTLEPYLYTIELSPEINKDAPVWALSINISKQDYLTEAQTEKIQPTKENTITVGEQLGLTGSYKTTPSGWTGRTIVIQNQKASVVIRTQKEFETEIKQILSTFIFTRVFDTMRKADLNIIRSGLELFRADQGKYPSTLKELVANKYMVTIPKDRETNSEYYYQISQTGLDYSLSAKLNDGTTYTIKAPK